MFWERTIVYKFHNSQISHLSPGPQYQSSQPNDFYPLYDNFESLLSNHNMLLDLKKTFILFGNSNLITMNCTHLNIIILYYAIGPKMIGLY